MGKYPTPEEVVAKYKRSVDLAKEKWAGEAKLAADRDLFIWYTAFAAKVYDVVSTLEDKTGDLETDVKNRVVPVAKAIKELSELYRKKRSEAMKKKSEASLEKAEKILGLAIIEKERR